MNTTEVNQSNIQSSASQTGASGNGVGISSDGTINGTVGINSNSNINLKFDPNTGDLDTGIDLNSKIFSTSGSFKTGENVSGGSVSLGIATPTPVVIFGLKVDGSFTETTLGNGNIQSNEKISLLGTASNSFNTPSINIDGSISSNVNKFESQINIISIEKNSTSRDGITISSEVEISGIVGSRIPSYSFIDSGLINRKGAQAPGFFSDHGFPNTPDSTAVPVSLPPRGNTEPSIGSEPNRHNNTSNDEAS